MIVPTVVSCSAPYGVGGLGQHLAQVVEEVRKQGNLLKYFATQRQSGDNAGEEVSYAWLPWLMQFTPMRFSSEWRAYFGNLVFDYATAERLPKAKIFVGFAGSALASFRQARQKGYEQLWLESPTAHVNRVRQLYDRAHAKHPIEGDWLGERLLKRTIEEYHLADVIVVNSEYVRESFLAEGFPASKLRRRYLAVDKRFRIGFYHTAKGGFSVVYIGSLYVTKGINVLLDAFFRLNDPQARLTLVGNSGSRGMRRYLAKCLARDPRVRIAPGDPLQHLQRADVCVHPSYQDGFGLAPMEALVCGIPVIVTEDTGMKEYVREGENGYIIPSGDPDALLERLLSVRAGALKPLTSQISD